MSSFSEFIKKLPKHVLVCSNECELNPEEWKYKAEGAANIILEYTGNNPILRGSILRLLKRATNNAPLTYASSGFRHHGELESFLFVKHVMAEMIGTEYVKPGKIILTPREFLREISQRIEEFRPHFRREAAQLDERCHFGLLIPDLTNISIVGQHSGTTTTTTTKSNQICVEIKPKVGFICHSELISGEHAKLKHSVCRFCMHQYYKLKMGEVASISGYCPQDLFSKDINRVKKALHSLIRTPQNNLKLYINGQLGWAERFRALASATTPLQRQHQDCCSYGEQLNKLLVGLNFANTEDCVEEFVEVMARVLLQSGILQRLKQVQELDLFDIECIYKIYTKVLADKTLSNKADITREERLFHFFDWDENQEEEEENSSRSSSSNGNHQHQHHNSNGSCNDNKQHHHHHQHPRWVEQIYEQLDQLRSLRRKHNADSESVCLTHPKHFHANYYHHHHHQTQGGASSSKVLENPYAEHAYNEEVRKILSIISSSSSSSSSSDTAAPPPPPPIDKEFVLKLIREFLIAQTAKDCSLMITLVRKSSRDTSPEEIDEFSSSFDVVKFEREKDGSTDYYFYRIGVVDLDPKSVARIPHYYKLDKAIVEHYASIAKEHQQQ